MKLKVCQLEIHIKMHTKVMREYSIHDFHHSMAFCYGVEGHLYDGLTISSESFHTEKGVRIKQLNQA